MKSPLLSRLKAGVALTAIVAQLAVAVVTMYESTKPVAFLQI